MHAFLKIGLYLKTKPCKWIFIPWKFCKANELQRFKTTFGSQTIAFTSSWLLFMTEVSQNQPVSWRKQLSFYFINLSTDNHFVDNVRCDPKEKSKTSLQTYNTRPILKQLLLHQTNCCTFFKTAILSIKHMSKSGTLKRSMLRLSWIEGQYTQTQNERDIRLMYFSICSNVFTT